MPQTIEITGTLGESYGLLDFIAAADRAGPDAAVRLECPGGDCSTGLAIADEIAERELDVDGSAVGSAAVAVLASGRRRTLSADGHVFLHLSSVITCGHADSLHKIADALRAWDAEYSEIVAKRSRLQPDDVLNMMRNETTLTPQQALDHGLVDEITPAAGLDARQRDTDQMAKRREMMDRLRSHMNQYAMDNTPKEKRTLEFPLYQRMAAETASHKTHKLAELPRSPYAWRFKPLEYLTMLDMFLHRVYSTTAPVRFMPMAWLDDRANIHHEPPPTATETEVTP